jgi:N-methylhydantoinase B
MQIDPVTLEVCWSRLITICDEAATALVRTSFSSAIRDFHDYACALFDGRKRMIAQSSHTTPGLLGILPNTVQAMCAALDERSFQPGDVIVTNDPWIATGHLIDITLMTPIFKRDRLVGFAICSVHHLDMGGRMATTESRDIFEEGLKIPVCKLYKVGVENTDVFDFVRANVRMRDKIIGDIRAQVASNHITAERVCEFLDSFALPDLVGLGDEIVSRTERAFRRVIAEIPDGRYYHAIDIDRLSEDAAPIHLECAIDVVDDGILVDYAGTSPQVSRSINSPLTMTRSYTYYPFKAALLPQAPNNQGCLEPIRVTAPDASVLNARWPAATWGRTIVVHYLPELIMGALGKVIPGRVIAGGGASPLWYENLAGTRKDGRPFFAIMAHHGGLGARPTKDGTNCLSFPANVANVPIEISENDAPILYLQKMLAPDSGGAGKMRGGLGQRVSFVVLDGERGPEGEVTIGLRGGRFDYPVPGILGGANGSAARVWLNSKSVRSGKQYYLKAGDRLEFEISGGGGYGDPKERDPAMVLEDLRLGYISAKSAREIYEVDPSGGITATQPGPNSPAAAGLHWRSSN